MPGASDTAAAGFSGAANQNVESGLDVYLGTIAFWGICILLSEKRIFEILELCSTNNRFSFQSV